MITVAMEDTTVMEVAIATPITTTGAMAAVVEGQVVMTTIMAEARVAMEAAVPVADMVAGDMEKCAKRPRQ